MDKQEELDRIEEAGLIKKYAHDKDEVEAYEMLFDLLRLKGKSRRHREMFIKNLFAECEEVAQDNI